MLAYQFTERAHGDLAVGGDPATLAARRRDVMAGPWTWLRQEHGAEVVVVTEPGEHAGAVADAAVTTVAGAVLAVHTADCAPLLLEGPHAIAVVHAGWRGLVAGVVEAAATVMADLGSAPTDAVLGPCIRPRCYEFAEPDLSVVADRYGPTVRSTTAWGTPALDVAAGVRVACERLGVALLDEGLCTACSPNHFSHRARGDAGRQALVARLGG